MLLLVAASLAELPMPTFPECGEIDRPDLCPDDLGTDWSFISYIPEGSRETVRAAELDLGSGGSVDRAWRVSAGRFDVTLAVLDSGFDWSNTDYVNKILLNTDELPLPQYADGTSATGYDADGNGFVNVQDWAEDTRVSWSAGRDVADGLLDPSDLIYTFSDGVDDDGNGYPDDIAGWDFFGDDNDPYHEYADDFGTHGDGVVEEMAAEGNDGGDIGACPNCSVLLVRVGDTFVTDGTRAGLGILYAVDRGARAANLSVGALTGPAFTHEAAEVAYQAGVSLVGAAGDENAYHHNQPALYEHFLYVKSLHSNNGDENSGTYSYFNTWNCNNYGPRLSWSVASGACATGAAAVTTGSIGLLHSAAADLGLTLSPDEIYQLIAMNVDDIWLTAEEQDLATSYPSDEGWDVYHGYGRLNAGDALAALAAGRIPPTADVSFPGWFDLLPPTGTLDIQGRIAADRSASFTYVVEYGTGADPRSWTTLNEGSGSAPIEGTLASLDLTTLDLAAIPEPETEEGVTERVDRVLAPAVTVRVRVTSAEGVEGSFRKTFYVQDDPDLVDGFPVDMEESGESSPILFDLDGDGLDEIVVGTGGGRIHAYTLGGGELSGFPLVAPELPRTHGGAMVYDGFVATIALGDLEGDGTPEIVAASGSGRVYAWHADGSMVTGFPAVIQGREPDEFDSTHTYDNGIAGAPTLADLDGDGALEVVVGAMDQRLYVWDAAGQPWGPYPIEVCDPLECFDGTRIINSPAVGDVDGDGDLDIGLGSNETVEDGSRSISYVFDGPSGTLLPGWPIRERGLVGEAGLLPIVGEGHPGSMAFADLDDDGKLEVASPIMLGQMPLFTYDGQEYLDLSYVSADYGANTNAGEPSFVTMANQPSFGDMNNDGVPEFIIGGAGANYLITLALTIKRDWQNAVGAWDGATGAYLDGWPRQIEDLQFLHAAAIADITGDGAAEAIIGSGGELMYAWDADGDLAGGWPKFTGGWIIGSPSVGDVDGDGYLEVAVTTREGNLFVWHTQGRADQALGWASIHHDPQNTGNAETPLPVRAGPPDEKAAEEECGCGVGAEPGLFALLGLLALRRRRRATGA